MTPKYWFVFDVESVGLHGPAFAVGVVVLDGTSGKVLQEARIACRPRFKGARTEDCQWVRENVPQIFAAHPSGYEVRSAFWALWQEWKNQGATMAADCPWPVEARFLADCIDDDPEVRNWEGPYPLVDIGSVLLGLGINPATQFSRQADEMPAHDPLNDARQSARVLLEALAVQEWRAQAALVGMDKTGPMPDGPR